MNRLNTLRTLLVLSTAWALSACSTLPTHPALQGSGQPPLLPARTFFANTQSSGNHQVSPDGRQLAWVGVHGTGPALFVKPLGAEGVDRVVATGVGGFQWAQDSRHVLMHKDQGGNENHHLLALDTQAAEPQARDLTPWPGVAAHLLRTLPAEPLQVLVVHNRRDKRLFDLYRLNIVTGEQTLLAQNPGQALGVVTHPDGRVLGHVLKDGERVNLRVSFQGLEHAREVLHWSTDDRVSVLGPDEADQGLYLLSNRGRDRRALTHLSLASGTETVLHEDPDVDIERVVMSASGLRPLATVSHPGHQRLHVLDEGWRADLQRLLAQAPRRLTVLSTTQDEQLLTLMVDTDQGREFLLADRRSGTHTLLARGTTSAHADTLGRTVPVQFQARDGLPLHGYLTQPPGGPRSPGPMVLLVHGGPWARDHWDNSLGQVQFLVNRGYAVLQVNYRGSTGYGKRFMQAAVGEFAGRMHTDLLDAVDWAVAQGVADRQKVAVMGASYGGYASLVGLSFTPEVFACGVSMVGVSDLVRLVENVPPYWEPHMASWHRYVGNPAIAEQRRVMAEKSPIHRVSAITKPLLVIQTTNDVRVRQDQADTLVQAMREQGKPVQYMLFEQTGHRYSSWTWGKWLRAHRAVEDFLGQCLGGRTGGTDFLELAAWMF
jgi:dipeptidyl aminopeptidase/acylaminoacyl peptidase